MNAKFPTHQIIEEFESFFEIVCACMLIGTPIWLPHVAKLFF